MKNQKSSYKKFAKKNKVLLAALGGVAAGIAVSSLIGTEKAKEMLKSVEGNIMDFSKKMIHGANQETSNDLTHQ